MSKYTLIIESDNGRALKIDGAYLDQEDIPLDGGIIRFKARKIIEIKKEEEGSD